jgi:hypothetical protein
MSVQSKKRKSAFISSVNMRTPTFYGGEPLKLKSEGGTQIGALATGQEGDNETFFGVRSKQDSDLQTAKATNRNIKQIDEIAKQNAENEQSAKRNARITFYQKFHVGQEFNEIQDIPKAPGDKSTGLKYKWNGTKKKWIITYVPSFTS